MHLDYNNSSQESFPTKVGKKKHASDIIQLRKPI